jgi:hypothetical protein
MPATSVAQARFMGAELGRARAGKSTRTGMSQTKLRHFASTPRKALPYRAANSRKARRRQAAAIRSRGR